MDTRGYERALKEADDRIAALRAQLAEAQAERDGARETVTAVMARLVPLVADAAIVGRTYGHYQVVAQAEHVVAEIASLQAQLAEAQAEADRAWKRHDEMYQDRYDALNAQTTDGMSAAEWQLRTGKAERERDEARAALAEAQRERDDWKTACDRRSDDWEFQKRRAFEAEAQLAEAQATLRDLLPGLDEFWITTTEGRLAILRVEHVLANEGV